MRAIARQAAGSRDRLSRPGLVSSNALDPSLGGCLQGLVDRRPGKGKPMSETPLKSETTTRETASQNKESICCEALNFEMPKVETPAAYRAFAESRVEQAKQPTKAESRH